MASGESVRLRMHSGIPIVDVLGDRSEGALRSLVEMVRALVDAGHFDIIVNLKLAAVTGAIWLEGLAKEGRAVRAHCGHIDVVATREQAAALAQGTGDCLFRLATSEGLAIGRIKRIPVLSAGSGSTARTME